MKKIFGLLSLVTLLLAGCSVKELENSQNIEGVFPTFYASFGDAADEMTKTYVNDKMSLRWTKDDRLSIFVGNTFNHEYKFDGETGANNGSFSAITSPEFIAAEPLDANYAIYPYNASNEMSSDGSMSVLLPSVQKYAQNSFGLGANTMVAATENKEDNFLQFKNLCGYVVVKLYGEGTVTSIKLEGNDGEKISGKADAQAAFGTLPSVTMSEEATTSITLDCGDGVTLGTTAETATEFWFCVPPVTFSKGFTVTATKADGWQMIKSTSSSKEVVRNTKNAMTPIEGVFDTPSAEVVPPVDEIWYTTKDNQIIKLKDNPFDVNVISHTYSNGKGIIKCDGAIKVLNSCAFDVVMNIDAANISSILLPNSIEELKFAALHGIGASQIRLPDNLSNIEERALNSPSFERFIGNNVSSDGRCVVMDSTLIAFAPSGVISYKMPECIKTIGVDAFLESPNLEVLILNDNVTKLKDYAFCGCKKLKEVVLSARLNFITIAPFAGCDNLESIYFRSPLPPAHMDDSYSEISNLNMYVPRYSLALYQNAFGMKCITPFDYEDIPDEVKIDYYISNDFSADGIVHSIQTAKKGNGINIVLMGDAFSDRQIADGTYNNVMQKAVNALFIEEPYKSFKDYFNVYSVDVISFTEGYEHDGQKLSVVNRSGNNISYSIFPERAVEYALCAVAEESMDEVVIIVLRNKDEYGGICWMCLPESKESGYGSGTSVVTIDAFTDTDTFAQLLHHEALGHGFAKLADEYAYEENGSAPIDYVSEIKSQQSDWGWWKNVDFTSDPTQVKWSKFLSDERYANEGLGCFEGGLTYWSGVWRPTDNSIMRYNTGGFNAPSREAIWYRIHKLAYGEDWEYNYEDFVTYDAINRTPAAQAASRAKVKAAAAARKGKPFQPLHEPVVIKRNWKEAVNNPGKDGR